MKMENPVILIVDDEPDICWALENILKKYKVSSRKAMNGAEAIRLVKSSPFSLVFLDAKLPDMDGLEVARQIRSIDPFIRIIMLSGYFYTHDVTVQKALAEGSISGFLGKPFQHVEIQKVIYGIHSIRNNPYFQD